jgi:hypothetical protein
MTTGVFIAGPYRVSTCPTVIRLDVDYIGSVSFYVCFKAYDGAGALKDLNIQGVSIAAGSAMVFPFASLLTLSTVDHVDIYLKIVHRSADALVNRFLVQAV